MPETTEASGRRRGGRAPRILAGVAGILLLGTAVFHGSGFGGVAAAIASSTADEFIQAVVPGLWLFFSWHLMALGLAAGVAAWRGGATMRPLVGFTAIVVLGDLLWVLKLAGVFVGTALLALTVLCLVAALARWERSA